MKIIKKYQALDGREFVDEASCLNHETILRNIEMVMSHLVKSPDSCEFQNGHGFIQQRPSDVEMVKNAIIDKARVGPCSVKNFCINQADKPSKTSM